jgi:hypothetical protein
MSTTSQSFFDTLAFERPTVARKPVPRPRKILLRFFLSRRFISLQLST